MRNAIKVVKDRIKTLEESLGYAESRLKECMKNTRNAEIECMRISTSLEDSKAILAELESEYKSQEVSCINDTESCSEET